MEYFSKDSSRPAITLPCAVIFDMDGVIFDTETLYVEAAGIAAEELGYAIPNAFTEGMIGLSWEGTRQLLEDTFGLTFPLEKYVEVWLFRFEGLASTQLRLKSGVRELIRTLDQLRIPKAIATGALSHNVRQHLAAHSLSNSFSAIITHEDCSVGKPAPDPFFESC